MWEDGPGSLGSSRRLFSTPPTHHHRRSTTRTTRGSTSPPQHLVRHRLHRLPAHRDGRHGHLRALPAERRASRDPSVWGTHVLEAADAYRIGNRTSSWWPACCCSASLGAVHVRLRRADATRAPQSHRGTHAGALLALVWPTPRSSCTRRRPLARGRQRARTCAWPAGTQSRHYSLAFSALPRVFFFVMAIVLALRLVGDSPWLQRTGIAIALLASSAPRPRSATPSSPARAERPRLQAMGRCARLALAAGPKPPQRRGVTHSRITPSTTTGPVRRLPGHGQEVCPESRGGTRPPPGRSRRYA